MIRYIDLSGMITLEDNDFWFAWYNTITDKFLTFHNTQIWFCRRCLDFHVPEWNCVKRYRAFPGKKTIDAEVKQIMSIRT